MVDRLHIREVVEKALAHAQAAKLGYAERMDHAVRALVQAHPELSEQEALTAVRRVVRPE